MRDDETTLHYALRYAELGFSVVPVHRVTDGVCDCGNAKCGAPGKHPKGQWRARQKERMDPAAIRSAWSEQGLEPNIGIVTGEISGVVVIDIDSEEGMQNLVRVGLDPSGLPPTPVARTGRGGWHIYCRYPKSLKLKTKAKILPGVDVRADGGLAVAPPSRHLSGGQYVWLDGSSPFDVDPADIDLSVLARLQEGEEVDVAPAEEAWYLKAFRGMESGERNDMATRLAGRLIGMGHPPKEAEAILLLWNERNDPPLPDHEIAQTVRSIARREAQQVGGGQSLDRLTNLLHVPIRGIQRLSGDDPKYVLDLEGGRCTLTTAQLLCPRAFQQAICEATGKIIPLRSSRSKPTHEAVAQMVISTAEVVDVGDDATDRGELLTIIREYLGGRQIVPEGEGIPSAGCFRKDGRIWVAILDLIQCGSFRLGVRQSLPQMAQRLRAFGALRKDFRECGPRWGIEISSIYPEGEPDGALANEWELTGDATE
jgi:hypothetical protein